MMIFISCAKTMTAHTAIQPPFMVNPEFEEQAKQHVLSLMQWDVDEIARMFKVNIKLASQNVLRYQDFFSPQNKGIPALLAYTGIVFKRIFPKDFTPEDFLYAQDHLRISSFLYGLLRPLDAIRNYRLEGDVKLPEYDGLTLFAYWKPLLTDFFIRQIKAQGGVLVYLASAEMKDLFDWKKVEKEVRVITPEFYTLKNEKLSTIVIYTKMCRGEMTRYLLKNRIQNPEDLKQFQWEGFCFSEKYSADNQFVFVQQ